MNSIHLFKLRQVSLLSTLKLTHRLFNSTVSTKLLLAQKSTFLKSALPLQNQSRTFWETFPSPVMSFYIKDGLDRKKYELVHKSNFFNYAFYAQFFSMTAFAIQIFYSTYHAYCRIVLQHTVEKITHVGPFEMTYDLSSFVVLSLFTCQNLFLYYLAQRAVLRVYHEVDTDNYKFITLSTNPFKSRLLPAGHGDLIPLHIDNLAAMFGNYKLNNRKIFLKLEDFKNVWHYNKLIAKDEEI